MEDAASLAGAARRLHLVFESAEAFRTEYARNLIKAGAFIATTEHFDLLEPVEVIVEAAFADEKVSLAAEVVHHQPGAGVSVQFSDPLSTVRARLEPLMERAEEFAWSGFEVPTPEAAAPGDAEIDLIDLEEGASDLDAGAAAPALDDDTATESEDPNERTQHTRAPRTRTRVSVLLRGPDGKQRHAGSRDLSTSGLLLSLHCDELPVGTDLSLSIVHPVRGDAFQVPARIVRQVRAPGIVAAVAVQVQPRDKQAALDRFIADLRGTCEEQEVAGVHDRFTDTNVAASIKLAAALTPKGIITISSGIEEGTIVFAGREMLAAYLGATRGVKALSRMLAWRDGFFEFRPGMEPLPHPDAPMPIDSAIADALRLAEQVARLPGARFAPDTRFLIADECRSDTQTPLEDSVVELAAAGATLREMLDRLPDTDAAIHSAVDALAEQGVLRIR